MTFENNKSFISIGFHNSVSLYAFRLTHFREMKSVKSLQAFVFFLQRCIIILNNPII